VEWKYTNDEGVDVEITEYPESKPHGFVYEITYDDGTKYLGKKTMVAKSTLAAKRDGTIREGAERIHKRKPMTEEDLKNRTKAQIRTNVKNKLVPYDVIYKESDWKRYVGSSKRTHEKEIVCKRILEFASTNRQLTYLEVKHLFLQDVLHSDEYINDNILGKFHRDNLI